jgi:hypothetical protein
MELETPASFKTFMSTDCNLGNSIECRECEQADKSIQTLKSEAMLLEDMVRHAWVHSGYPSCGYKQMTTDQKKAFCQIIGAQFSPLHPVFPE